MTSSATKWALDCAIGDDHSGPTWARIAVYGGEDYYVVSGTGDTVPGNGGWLYRASDVAEWADGLGDDEPTYQDLCDALDPVDGDARLAAAVLEECGVVICRRGTVWRNRALSRRARERARVTAATGSSWCRSRPGTPGRRTW